MSNSSFSASVSAFAAETKERMEAVFKESAQRVIETMQEPGPSKAGQLKAIAAGQKFRGRGANRKPVQGPVQMKFGAGSMPVDTGFLRSSLQISYDQPLPMRADAKPADGMSYTAPDVSASIAGANLGGHIYATYGAVYARRINYEHYLFVQKAAQRWPMIVEQVCADLQNRIGSSS